MQEQLDSNPELKALRLSMASPTPSYGFAAMTITPELATEWLKLNVINRMRLEPNVAFFEKAITEGYCYPTHQGLAFLANGLLVDGQNRLEACVRTGISIQAWVFRGMPLEMAAYLDTGKPKNWRHFMRSIDSTDKAVLQFAAQVLGLTTRSTLSDIAPMYSIIGPEMAELSARLHASKKFFTSAPVRLAVILTIATCAPEDREEVMTQYLKVAATEPDLTGITPAVNALYNYYTRNFSKARLQSTEPARADTLTRAHIAFDPANREIGKINVPNQSRGPEWARDCLRKLAKAKGVKLPGWTILKG